MEKFYSQLNSAIKRVTSKNIGIIIVENRVENQRISVPRQ